MRASLGLASAVGGTAWRAESIVYSSEGVEVFIAVSLALAPPIADSSLIAGSNSCGRDVDSITSIGFKGKR
jgi:hypothetical protein